ncbi:MAG TPA: hypothetical protein PKB15_07390 [Acidimicrobiia bacterium]|nr:hypothetical protein [Acidimicrobiia bacterium]
MASVTEISRIINELITLITTYIKEQTLLPLKRIGRYVGFGLAGSFFIAVGLFLLSLGFLRYLQTLSPFDDTFSFAPYLLVIVADLVVVGILFFVMTRRSLIKSRSVK